MKDGYIRVAAATPQIRVADPEYNELQLETQLEEAEIAGAKVVVFPELCLTGYTCQDLFWQTPLLRSAYKALGKLIRFTRGKDLITFVGMPWEECGKLYNVMAAVCNGQLLGMIPKTYIPNHSEFYEGRYFTKGTRISEEIEVRLPEGEQYQIPFGTDLLFRCTTVPGLVIGGEICEDVWVPNSPSIRHALAGATVIVNCSASDETTGKDTYRSDLIRMQSAKLVCGYICANTGEGESTTDLVFGGQNIIAEDGVVLADEGRFQNGIAYAEFDLERIRSERRRMGTFESESDWNYETVDFQLTPEMLKLHRPIEANPFVPSVKADRDRRCDEILSIQAMGLKTRLQKIGCSHAIVGISGGLDSTLALLVTVRAFDALKIPRNHIIAVTMPCFGTTDRTYNNACKLVNSLGAQLKEVNIKDSVRQHFKDIGHDESQHDVTYENAQARERTQILMDMSNQYNGIVVGTGDLSELALGWATYNGDHMSMYGVNASVPKTLVRHLVSYYADVCCDQELSEVLRDVLDTPVSPELLPPEENGEIAQKTEDLVGPYELHDFFLYHMLRFGYHPAKINRMANYAFEGIYDEETILKWQKIFTRRFFQQQFKRSCLPDGPKVGSVTVSPRGDLRMSSDSSAQIWIKEIEKLEAELAEKKAKELES
ncbi:MAG: NAD(+) synthase [Lachnospiraceae bacterium]|nr:NAD(+) synthase [Lachnospiraceae bacterium]